MLALALALPDMSARLQRFSIPIPIPIRVPFPISIPISIPIPVPLEKKVRVTTYLCVLAIACATLSTALWLPLSLVPVLGLVAIPNLLVCMIVLLYAIPSLAYLLLAQDHPPAHIRGLFLPLNPVRNFGILLALAHYLLFLTHWLPRWGLSVARLLLERLALRLGEPGGARPSPVTRDGEGGTGGTGGIGGTGGTGDVAERSGLFDGFAKFGIPYSSDHGREMLLDVYLPKTKGKRRRSHPTSHSPHRSTRPHAPDNDPSNLPPSTPASSPGPSSSPGPRPPPQTAPSTPSSSGIERSPSTRARRRLGRGKPVIVFLYDLGILGPIKPKRTWFVLLGAKLAEMGYVVVIPDITLYPEGSAETMVRDARCVLRWVGENISLHGGDPSSIFLSGHGLGAHLALFTLSQEAVVRSRDERELARSQIRHSGRRWREKAMAGHDEVFGWPATSTPLGGGSGEISAAGNSGGVGEGVPNGLRSLRVYGAEVAIPPVAGVILLSPVADIIKQIRHESSLWLEHLSPVRRALGPSQTMCMRNSLGHLLFAAKNVLQPDKLPRRVLVIHGAQDRLVPLDSAHWLSELLYGLDMQTSFRPYRNLGHFELITELMKGLEGEYSARLEHDLRDFIRDEHGKR